MPRRYLVLPLTALAAACASQFPAEFTPSPALLERIDHITMETESDRVCPGETINAAYHAVLDDGTVLPFAVEYDWEDPPQLHVPSLQLTSGEATAHEDGSWRTDADPLVSVMSGFRLNASLRAKPSVTASQVVAPEYSCLGHTFSFQPVSKSAGSPGPDVVVRLADLSTPFYERLLVASIEVGYDPRVYVFADLGEALPADWLEVESKGGRGRPGRRGRDGRTGSQGSGCSGSGGAGSNGEMGGPGGPGGRGGQITVIVPRELPQLVDVVLPVTTGGPGGAGGQGGLGGRGGSGARAKRDVATGAVICPEGRSGPSGRGGLMGDLGVMGPPGPPARRITLPWNDVLGSNPPLVLQELMEYTIRQRTVAEAMPEHQLRDRHHTHQRGIWSRDERLTW